MNVLARTVGDGRGRRAGSAGGFASAAVEPGSREDVVRLLREVGRAMHLAYMQQSQSGPVAEFRPQMRLFAAVAAQPGITISELARSTGMPKSQVSVQMARAVEQGLATREADDEDMRLVRLSLTVAGRSQLTRWRAIHHRVLLRVLRSIPAAQLASVTTSLGVLLTALQCDAAPRRGGAADPNAAGYGQPRGTT